MDATASLFVVAVHFFVSAVVAAVVAEEKNRSGIGFFFLGLLFLGPFAIAVAILAAPGAARPSLPPPPVQKIKQGPTVIGSRPGITVKVIAPGDDREGQTGTMHEMPDDDDDSQVCVRFTGDPELYAFGRDEVLMIPVSEHSPHTH